MLDPREIVALLPTVADDLTRVRVTVEPQYERVAAIQAGVVGLLPLLADVEAMRATIEPRHERAASIQRALDILPRLGADLTAIGQLSERLASLHHTLSLLKSDFTDATEHLPDPDAPGPIARAREALTAGA
jgi:hypothetical protein